MSSVPLSPLKSNQLTKHKQTTITLHNNNKISFDSAFSIHDTGTNEVQIISDNFALFSCGNMIVLSDLYDKTKYFYEKEGRFKNISVIQGAYDKSKYNILIAVGESSIADDKSILLTVISRNNNAWYMINTNNAKGVIKQIALNYEYDYIACSFIPFGSNFPLMYIWNFKKDKLVASMQPKLTPFFKFLLNHKNNLSVLLMGEAYLRVWTFIPQEKILKEGSSLVSAKIEKESEFIDMCYAPTNSNPLLAVLCKHGKMMLFQNEVLKRTLDLDISSLNVVDMKIETREAVEVDDLVGINYLLEDPSNMLNSINDLKDITSTKKSEKGNQQIFSDAHIEYLCMTPTKKGFALGGTHGFISFYSIDYNSKGGAEKSSINNEKSGGTAIEKMINLTNTENYQIKNMNPEDKITNISCSSNMSILSLVFQSKDLEREFYLINFQMHLNSDISTVHSFLSAGFHRKKITSISMSRSKSVYATSGLDNIVRVWSYRDFISEEKEGVIFTKFKETPHCVALHPLGFFLAIAFSSGFKVFTTMKDSLYVVKETNLVHTYLIKYSNGGQYLFANEKSNILVYDGVYYENLYSFEDHNNQIIDFMIINSDKALVSVDAGGFTFFWNFQKQHESHQNIDPAHILSDDSYKSIDYDQTNGLFVGVTSKYNLVIYKNNCREQAIVPLPATPDCYYQSIKISTQLNVLAAGTSKGSVRLHPWPFEELEKLKPVNLQKAKFFNFVEISCFVHPVSVVIFSPGSKQFVVCDVKGNHLLLKCTKIEEEVISGENQVEDRAKHHDVINDLYFSRNAKLKEQNDQIKRLQFEYKKMEQAMMVELEKLKESYDERKNVMEKNFTQSIEETNVIKEEFIAKANSNFESRKAEFEFLNNKYDAEKVQADVKNTQLINYEKERNQLMKKELEDLKNNHKKKIEDMINNNKNVIEKVKSELQLKLEQIDKKYNSIIENAQVYGSTYLDMIAKEEHEHEKEIGRIQWDLEKRITIEQKLNEDLKKENEKLSSENEQSKANDIKKQQKFEKLVSENTNFLEQKVKICIGLLKMQEQLLEREQVIFTKEETLKNAKDEQINLENFRFMLDQKIKGLTAEKEDLTKQIAGQEKILNEMFEELIKESNKNRLTYKDVKAKKTMINILNEEKKKREIELFAWADKLKAYQNKIRQGLMSCRQVDDVYKMLKKTLDEGGSIDPTKINLKNNTQEDIINAIGQSQSTNPNIHEEIVIQNKWLAKKLNIIDMASRNIQQIREENIAVALNQNKNLIKQCNELREENDYYLKELKKLKKHVKEATHKKEKLDRDRIELQKKQNKFKQMMQSPENVSSIVEEQKESLLVPRDSHQEILPDILPSQELVKLPPIKPKKNGSIPSSSTDISHSKNLSSIISTKGKEQQIMSHKKSLQMYGENINQKIEEEKDENQLKHKFIIVLFVKG